MAASHARKRNVVIKTPSDLWMETEAVHRRAEKLSKHFLDLSTAAAEIGMHAEALKLLKFRSRAEKLANDMCEDMLRQILAKKSG